MGTDTSTVFRTGAARFAIASDGFQLSGFGAYVRGVATTSNARAPLELFDGVTASWFASAGERFGTRRPGDLPVSSPLLRFVSFCPQRTSIYVRRAETTEQRPVVFQSCYILFPACMV